MKRILLAALFSLLIIGAAENPIPQQTGDGTAAKPFIIFKSDTLSIAFDKQAADLDALEVEVVSLADPPAIIASQVFSELLPSGNTQLKVFVIDMVVSIPDGVYRFRARVRSSAGLWSGWSDYLHAQKNWVAPDKPGGCIFSW